MKTQTMTNTQKLVYGHGTNDLNDPVYKNGSNLKFYATWKAMLRRCYSGEYQDRFPTYRNCSVCDSWLKLSVFKVWFDVNYREGMALDKDILIPGNRIYRPKACRFVPGYINSLLTDAKASRGELPCGVVAVRSKLKNGQITTTYQSRCNDGRGERPNKVFRTVPEARQQYITTKKRVAGQQAIRAFAAGDITEDVYQALISREW